MAEPGAAASDVQPSTRLWLTAAHSQLQTHLPAGSKKPLLTEEMVDAQGHATDVFAHFGLRRGSLQSMFRNFAGLRCTAQAASQEYFIDQPAPPWSGFEDVWIPVGRGVSLSGRLGYARDNQGIRTGDCIVIMPGLFGDNGVKRTQDMACFLRDSGFHVLALELRGHGQTEARHPEAYCLFGVVEADELMRVSDWLTSQPHVLRTGLMGYCWSANIALLAAWFDGREPNDPSIHPRIVEELGSIVPQRRFTAGIMAFSPIVKWEDLLDELDTPRSGLKTPVYAAIQDTIKERMRRKDYPNPSGSLRTLIDLEYQGHRVILPNGVTDGYPFIRLLDHAGHPAGNKMERARVPVLIVHGCDDPLAPAQDVADFVATVRNPRLAALILPGGGHVGFAPYAREYYFSLVASFFDPQTGAGVR